MCTIASEIILVNWPVQYSRYSGSCVIPTALIVMHNYNYDYDNTRQNDLITITIMNVGKNCNSLHWFRLHHNRPQAKCDNLIVLAYTDKQY